MLRACELKTMFSGSISWETWDPKPIMFGSIQGHGRQARPIFFLREVLEKNIVKFSTNDLYDLGHLTIAIWILWERSPKPKIARHSHMWQRAYRFFGCTYEEISWAATFFSWGTRAQHLTLYGVRVVSPGWMICSNRSERKDNCTVTISVCSTGVRTAVGTI